MRHVFHRDLRERGLPKLDLAEAAPGRTPDGPVFSPGSVVRAPALLPAPHLRLSPGDLQALAEWAVSAAAWIRVFTELHCPRAGATVEFPDDDVPQSLLAMHFQFVHLAPSLRCLSARRTVDVEAGTNPDLFCTLVMTVAHESAKPGLVVGSALRYRAAGAVGGKGRQLGQLYRGPAGAGLFMIPAAESPLRPGPAAQGPQLSAR